MQGSAGPGSAVTSTAFNCQRAAQAFQLGLGCLFRAKGHAVTILAIWFGVAVVVGVLLGYAASRLKRAPERQLDRRDLRKVGDADVDQHKAASPRRSSMKTNKFYRRLWRI